MDGGHRHAAEMVYIELVPSTLKKPTSRKRFSGDMVNCRGQLGLIPRLLPSFCCIL